MKTAMIVLKENKFTKLRTTNKEIMKTILTVLISLFLLTSCTQDELLREENIDGTYIGTFDGDAQGVFRAEVVNGTITGTTKIGQNVIDSFDGTIIDNSFTASGDVSTGAVYIGTIISGEVNGEWENSDNLSGTFTGTKQ